MIQSPHQRTNKNGLALQTEFLPYDIVRVLIKGFKENQTEKVIIVLASWLQMVKGKEKGWQVWKDKKVKKQKTKQLKTQQINEEELIQDEINQNEYIYDEEDSDDFVIKKQRHISSLSQSLTPILTPQYIYQLVKLINNPDLQQQLHIVLESITSQVECEFFFHNFRVLSIFNEFLQKQNYRNLKIWVENRVNNFMQRIQSGPWWIVESLFVGNSAQDRRTIENVYLDKIDIEEIDDISEDSVSLSKSDDKEEFYEAVQLKSKRWTRDINEFKKNETKQIIIQDDIQQEVQESNKKVQIQLIQSENLEEQQQQLINQKNKNDEIIEISLESSQENML